MQGSNRLGDIYKASHFDPLAHLHDRAGRFHPHANRAVLKKKEPVRDGENYNPLGDLAMKGRGGIRREQAQSIQRNLWRLKRVLKWR